MGLVLKGFKMASEYWTRIWTVEHMSLDIQNLDTKKSVVQLFLVFRCLVFGFLLCSNCPLISDLPVFILIASLFSIAFDIQTIFGPLKIRDAQNF